MSARNALNGMSAISCQYFGRPGTKRRALLRLARGGEGRE
jgi:hypothetical protein